MDQLIQYSLSASRYVLIFISVAIIVRCLRSMLNERYESEIWAYINTADDTLPISHWENIIGRSRSADIRITHHGLSRVHAVLSRNDRGTWRIYDIFSKGGVWVNGLKVGKGGVKVVDGDVINLAGSCVHFMDVNAEERRSLEAARTSAGHKISPAITLLELTVFQLFLLLQHSMSANENDFPSIALAFLALIIIQWCCYNAMRIMNRSGFEVETLAFYLTTLGLSVVASSTPGDMYKQIVLILVSVALFLTGGWWLRKLRRTMAVRIPVAILALLMLAVNVVSASTVFGARNWLEMGGYSFQPSELVKAAYIYVGASTLDRLFRKKNLYSFIVFSGICVIALALIGDFGTALIFFVSFLVISFMRSGSIATVLLAVSGAGLAGFLAVTVKPYIAQRFSAWGHVWEDVYNTGYQQTRAMSAAASGGVFGKGAGAGWLTSIFAANTDMVFAVICEELGLIIGLCTVFAVLLLAFFAVRSARHGRSAYYAIAACAAMSMLLVQLALNVFGSLDILPFTGVTFPFVSKGGTSLLSCWMLMAFIKGADTRRDASFAVRSVSLSGRGRRTDNVYYDEDDNSDEDYRNDDNDCGDGESDEYIFWEDSAT